MIIKIKTENFEDVNEYLESIVKKIKEITDYMSQNEDLYDSFIERFKNAETSIKALNKRFDSLERKVDRIESKITSMQYKLDHLV